ncbi:MAG: hypothetical protein K2O40_07845, partial [Lachnospiraceae bacterium]|nr:hypothetical protein [Lachnospiraceae bacterium]
EGIAAPQAYPGAVGSAGPDDPKAAGEIGGAPAPCQYWPAVVEYPRQVVKLLFEEAMPVKETTPEGMPPAAAPEHRPKKKKKNKKIKERERDLPPLFFHGFPLPGMGS